MANFNPKCLICKVRHSPENCLFLSEAYEWEEKDTTYANTFYLIWLTVVVLVGVGILIGMVLTNVS